MKKNLVLVAMATALLVGCSQDDVKTNGSDEPLKVRLTAGAPTVSVTRSTGTVGDIEGNVNNVWNNQTVYVYALSKTDRTNMIMENKKAEVAPGGTVTWADGADIYFPVDNTPFDFFAYHVDDAVDNNAEVAVASIQKDNSNDIYLDVTINGAQDLMTAKANLTEDQKTQLKGTRTNEEAEVEYAKAFSAYTARRSVQPILSFKHVLTRFVFNVVPGVVNANEVSIDSLGIYSKSQGRLYFAMNKATEDSLAVVDADMGGFLYLKQRNIASGVMEDWAIDTYKPAAFIQDDNVAQTSTRVGESLIVMPQDENYMTNMMEQLSGLNITPTPQEGDYVLDIRLSQEINGARKFFSYQTPIGIEGGFKAGNSYTVNLTVYGLQKVDITTQLTGWADGGNINVDQDQF